MLIGTFDARSMSFMQKVILQNKYCSVLYRVHTWGTVAAAAGAGKCLEKMSRYMYSSLVRGVDTGNLYIICKVKIIYPCTCTPL